MRKALAISVVILLGGAACSGDDGETATTTQAADVSTPSATEAPVEETTSTVGGELDLAQAEVVRVTCLAVADSNLDDLFANGDLLPLAAGESGVQDLEERANTAIDGWAAGDIAAYESSVSSVFTLCQGDFGCSFPVGGPYECPEAEEIAASYAG